MDLPSKLALYLALVHASNQSALAALLGVSRPTVGNWLSGRRDLKSTELALLHQLGVDLNWLFDPDDDDMAHMFAYNTKGNELREKYWGALASMHKPARTEQVEATVPKQKIAASRARTTGKEGEASISSAARTGSKQRKK